MGALHPVTASTIISPPSGSLVPNSGSLLVLLADANNNGISGVTLTGSGAGSFTGTTGSSGCVLWHNLPAGNYAMSLSGAVSGLVDQDGNPPPGNTPTRTDRKRRGPGDQHREPLLRPARVDPGDQLQDSPYTGSLVTSSADSAVVSASGMTQGRVYGTPGGARQSTFDTGSNLFPFTSPYTVYGGSCSANDPTADASAAGAYGTRQYRRAVTATLASPGYVLLPSLLVTVHSGSSFLFPGSPVSSGKITVTELGSPTGCGVTRTLTTSTNSNGEVPVAGDVGLPYGTYSVCANNSGGSDKRP